MVGGGRGGGTPGTDIGVKCLLLCPCLVVGTGTPASASPPSGPPSSPRGFRCVVPTRPRVPTLRPRSSKTLKNEL